MRVPALEVLVDRAEQPLGRASPDRALGGEDPDPGGGGKRLERDTRHAGLLGGIGTNADPGI
jgi:hypothetical protein